MKIRRLENARELAGSCARTSLLAASLLTPSLPAFAQPEAAGEPPVSDPVTDAPAVEAPDATEPGALPETGSTAPSEPPEPAEPDSAAPPAPEAGAAPASSEAQLESSAAAPLEPNLEAPAAETETAAETPLAVGTAEPPPLRLELLPATAYPNDPIAGLEGGSLSLVINRLQWPYMPRYAGAPALRLGFSGFAWIDSSYRTIDVGVENESDETEFRQQGRLGLRVTPVYNVDDDYFVQSNIEFIAIAEQDHTVNNYADIDDAWIRVGKWKMFDVQVGRMQGFEVYHFGMGLDLNTYERAGATSFNYTPAQPYGLTDLWDRGRNVGAAAFHWYYPKWLRLEFLARFGLSGQGTDIGMRPVGVVDLGFVKLKAGYERRLRPSIFDDSESRIQTQGVGGELQFVLAPWVEFGGGAAHRVEDAFEQDGAVRPAASHTTYTYGGFVNARPYFEDWLVGLGYHHTYYEDFNFDAFGERQNSTHDQMFAAVQYLLWDKLHIKYVLSYADGHIEFRNDTDIDDTGFHNKALSHRLRLMVLY